MDGWKQQLIEIYLSNDEFKKSKEQDRKQRRKTMCKKSKESKKTAKK